MALSGLRDKERGSYKIATSESSKAAVVNLQKAKYNGALLGVLGLSEVQDTDSVMSAMSPLRAVQAGLLGVITVRYKGGSGTNTKGTTKLYCASDEIDGAMAKVVGKTVAGATITSATVSLRRRLY